MTQSNRWRRLLEAIDLSLRELNRIQFAAPWKTPDESRRPAR